MGDDERINERLSVVASRVRILDVLTDGPLGTRDIVDELDASRSTVNRALRELTDHDLVERSGEGYAATFAGRLTLNRYRQYRRESAAIMAADAVLGPLPVDCDLPVEVLVGAETTVGADPAPYRPAEQVQRAVESADAYRGLLATLADPRHVRLLYEHVVTDGNPAELVVTESLARTLAAEFPRRLSAMLDCDEFELLVGEPPPYGLVITDGADGPTVTVLVFDDGGVHGIVRNEAGDAVEWARDCFERASAGANQVTRLSADGGPVVTPRPLDTDRSPVLAREGFVRANRSYFADTRVAEPTRAWQAGLGLGEVHTGYAVGRHLDGGDVTVTDRLLERLTNGEHGVVLGPPGSGKSTVCKRVACRWYQTDRGAVFYREAGTGSAFESTGELVRQVGDAEGTPLVVVEDATRPDARGILGIVDDVTERGGVVLVDSRTTEWEEPPDSSEVPTDFAAPFRPVRMPRLLGEDCERLIERFEETVGETVPGGDIRDRLLADIDDAPRAAEPLLLLHRLSTYVDREGEGATTLTEDVDAVYDRLAAVGDAALDVGVAANALTAAGVAVTPALLYAVAPDDPETVEQALDLLDGRVLFGVEDGRYETVHDQWSIEALAGLSDEDAGRFGRVLTELLALADQPERREAARRRVDGPAPELQRIDADPAAWVEETVEGLFAVGGRHPKLARLYGTVDEPAVGLPAAAPPALEARTWLWLGRMQLRAGALDRAEATLERLREATAPSDGDAEALHVRALYRLGQVALHRGDLETAASRLDAGLDAAEAAGHRHEAALVRDQLGAVASKRRAFELAEERFSAALDALRELGDRRREAEALDHLGIVARKQGRLDAAGDYHERAIELAAETGSREQETKAVHNLGTTEKHRGNYAAAVERFETALERYHEEGDRRAEAYSLGSIGAVELNRGAYGSAAERAERAVDMLRDIGDEQGELKSLQNAGVARKRQGRLDEARAHFERMRSLAESVGIDQRVATADHQLGEIALREGDLAAARGRFECARSQYADIGHEAGVNRCREGMGVVAFEEGDIEAGRETVEAAVETARGLDERRDEGDMLVTLADLDRRVGEPARARDRLTAAVETFADAGGVGQALDAAETLLDICEELDEEATAIEWCERAVELADDPAFHDRWDALADRLARLREDG